MWHTSKQRQIWRSTRVWWECSINWENFMLLSMMSLQPWSSNVTLHLRILRVGSTLLCEKQLNPGSRPLTHRRNYPGAPCLSHTSIPVNKAARVQAVVFKVGKSVTRELGVEKTRSFSCFPSHLITSSKSPEAGSQNTHSSESRAACFSRDYVSKWRRQNKFLQN